MSKHILINTTTIIMKRLFTLIIVLLLVNTLRAQDGSDFKLGLTVHPNIGWMRSDIKGVSADGARVGFSYGVLGDFLFRESYAFSTALKLTTINGKTEETNNSIVNKNIYKLQYLEIPAKLKLLTSDENGMRFYGEFGIGNGFNVRAKADVKSNDPNNVADNKDVYKRMNFYRGSIILGGGVEIAMPGTTRLQAGVTFDNGFTDVQKGDGSLKSSYIAINLAVFF